MLKKKLSILLIMVMLISCLSHSAGHVYAIPDDGSTENSSPTTPTISIEAQYDQNTAHTWTQPLTFDLIIPAGSVFVAQDIMQITFPSNVDMDSVHISPEVDVTAFNTTTNENIFSLTSKAERTFANELRLPIEFHLQNVAETGAISATFISNGDAGVATPVTTSLAVISVDGPEPVGMMPYSAPTLGLFSAFPFSNPFRQSEYNARGFNNLISSSDSHNSLFHFTGPVPWHIYLALIVTNYTAHQDPVLTLYSSHPVIAESVMVTAQTSSATMVHIDESNYTIGNSTLSGTEFKTEITFSNFDSSYLDYFVNFAVGHPDLDISDTTYAAASYHDAGGNIQDRTSNANGAFKSGGSKLTVEKEVIGKYADTTLEFDFRMIISYTATPYLTSIPFTKIVANGPPIHGIITLDSQGFYDFKLAHGERIIFDIVALRDDTETWFRVYEPGLSTYESEEFINSIPAIPPSSETPRLLNNDATVLFRNTRTQPPVPTSAPIFDSPFTTMSLLAIISIIGYTTHIYYKKKITK
jgi:hypothetical protein